MFSQLSILISMLSEVLLLRYGRINEQGLPVSWRVCRWVKGFAGELKGLPVSWRVCRWVQGTIRTGGPPKRLPPSMRGSKGLPESWRVCQCVEGFAALTLILPPRKNWFSMTSPNQVCHDSPLTLILVIFLPNEYFHMVSLFLKGLNKCLTTNILFSNRARSTSPNQVFPALASESGFP